MLEKLFYFLIYCLNRIPERFARILCTIGGYCLYYGLPSRRRIVLHNLYIVFPQKTEKWRRKVGLIHCCRWVETAWAFLVTTCWSEDKIKQRIKPSAAFKNWIQDVQKNKRSAVVLVPHLNLMEAMTWAPCFFQKFPNTGVVYRPFRTKWFEDWIRKTRERFGLQLISRKRGVAPLEKILKNGGIVSLLFDQSAGETGCLTTFFERLASTTDLPGRLIEKYGSDAVVVYLKRTGFIRGELCVEEIFTPKKDALSITLAANHWLEGKLQTERCFFENWLWMHRRWKTQQNPTRRFQIYQKRNWLEETCQFFNWSALPRRTQVWIRMPNWLGDCVMTYPLIQAIRRSRPDFCIHLVAQRSFAPWLQRHFPVDFIHILPKKSGWAYFRSFWQIRNRYPDIWINFPNSLRSDFEAFCSGAPQRFGLQKKGKRYLLNHTFIPKQPITCHQTELWYQLFKNFGLKGELPNIPVEIHKKEKTIKSFACFCGSANTPQKRWPVQRWQKLIQLLLEHYPQAHCVLLGNAKDRSLCTDVLLRLPEGRVQNLAGQTSLPELECTLRDMDFIVANDSGGMHLANFFGIPTVGLFGPTNPDWGGPFFDAPKCIVQSPTRSIADLSEATVFECITDWLAE